MSPEPETDAMKDAVVEVTEILVSEGVGFHPEMLADQIVRALLEPRITKCATCGGSGYDSAPSDWPDEYTHENGPGPCPAEGCDQGQIVRPSIAVLRGDIVRSVRWSEEAGYPLYNVRSEEGTG